MIRDLGDRIPPTFSGERLKNTEGFAWYVSQHYALNTDFPAENAHHFLILLELAYPHLVEMFGREPTGIDQKRMAIVYAKEKETLAKAMATHGRAWDFRGGGITFNECSATYQYPSGGLQYHLRYILLHEEKLYCHRHCSWNRTGSRRGVPPRCLLYDGRRALAQTSHLSR